MISLIVLVASVILPVYFLARLHLHRRHFRSLNLPGPPHSYLLGHIGALVSVASSSPPKLHFFLHHVLLSRKYNLTDKPAFYLDLWPFGGVLCVVQSASFAAQMTQTVSMPKDAALYLFVRGFMGPESIGPMIEDGPGSAWRFWRSIFNPAFSPAYLTTLTGLVASKGLVFAEKLSEFAKTGEVVRLAEHTSALTVDIIGKLTVDAEFNTQVGHSELVQTMREIPRLVRPIDSFNIFWIYSPWRVYWHSHYVKKANKIIGQMLDERFKQSQSSQSQSGKKGGEKARYIVDLALQAYEKEMKSLHGEKHQDAKVTRTMDPVFRRTAIDNIKGFLFAGHETTSSTLSYAYHLLSTHPSTLARLRAEHATLFPNTTSPASTAALISSDPSLVSASRLPYTNAIINETLRLYPSAGAARIGHPTFQFIPDSFSTSSSSSSSSSPGSYPSSSPNLGPFSLLSVGFIIHRNIHNFPDPDSFIPDRFLAPNVDSMAKDAFRPFEKGRRNCIGLELALLELRVLLVMTARWFEFEARYDDHGPSESEAVSGGLKVLGERAYPVLGVATEPVDGLPVRVFERKNNH